MPAVLVALALVVALLLLFWAVARFHLSGPDLSAFDAPTGRHFALAAPSAAHGAVVASLGRFKSALAGVPRRQRVAALRKYVEEFFAATELTATFTPADADGVPAEWVLAPGADASRRMLYIHGGAFTLGSSRSHRRLTGKFAEITGGAVLAIDYRLMPEHRRIDGIADCRIAYRWLLAHGPQGAHAAARVWVAGDSAGGNLALSLLAWVRDQGLRAPDAAVALSPFTDATLASPSLETNRATDPMLGPLFGALARIPRAALLWIGWLRARINPSDPVVSPVYGDLSRLPRVLVQASAAEMLHDDARRYVNRARTAGSPVELQTWDHMVHVWHLFHPELAEGRAAFEEIRRFLADAPAP